MPNYIQDPDLLAQLDGPKTRTPEDFAKAYGPAAQRAATALKVDPQVLLGQWGLETGWGKSIIPGTNNLGNIKDFAGGGVAATDNMTGSRDKYRAYESPDAFADDFVSLVQRKYPAAVGAKDPQAFAAALKAGGYAEDPRYTDKVVQATRMAGTKQNPIMKAIGGAVEAITPSAQAGQRAYIQDPEILKQLESPDPEDKTVDGDRPAVRLEVRGTSADEPAPQTRTDRIIQGAVDPINGGAQLLTRMLPEGVVKAGNRLNNAIAPYSGGLIAPLPEGGVDQQVRENEIQYEAQRRAAAGGQDPGFDGARLVGNLLSPANLALGAAAPVKAAATLGARVGTAAATAGASGALTPVTNDNSENFAADKLKQVGISAAAGGVSQPVLGAIGRVISPNASTNPLLALLKKEGVQPSVGQSLGGTANKVEQRMTSIPIVGDRIAAARALPQDQLRQAAQNRVTEPIAGAAVKETGFEGVKAVSKQVDDAYDAARNAMGAFRLDQQAAQELGTIRQMVGQLDQKEQRAFVNVWNEIKNDISPNGTIPAGVFKKIDSKIGQDAARFAKSQDPYQQQLGAALGELQKSIQGAAKRQNPQAGKMFDQADEAFANLVRVQQAAKAAVNQEGNYTPGQLNAAVRGSDKSVRGKAVSQGDALMQDLSNAGQRVLGNTVPDSGTAGRLGSFLTGGAAVFDPVITGSLLAGGSLAYSQPAQSALRALVTVRPGQAQTIRNALLQASPALAPAAGQLGLAPTR